MEKLIYEIDGKKYILFEVELPIRLAKQHEKNIALYDGIIQTVKSIDSFWNGRSVNIKCLIPENKAIDFARHKSK